MSNSPEQKVRNTPIQNMFATSGGLGTRAWKLQEYEMGRLPLERAYYPVSEYPAPYTPLSATGVTSDIPQYQIPDAVLPTQGWYSNMSPAIQQAIKEPYIDASRELGEQLGSVGMMGSARGGASGAAANVLSDFWGQVAAPQMAMSAWNMMQPGLNQYRGDVLSQNIGARDELVNEATLDYQNEMRRREMEYQNALGYRGEMQNQSMAPFNLMSGLATGSMGGGYTTTSQPGFWSQAGQAALGALGGSIMGPVGAGIGGIIGGWF